MFHDCQVCAINIVYTNICKSALHFETILVLIERRGRDQTVMTKNILPKITFIFIANEY